MTTRPPILGAETWLAVMYRAGFTCGCEGECGAKHRDTGGRCITPHKENGRADGRLVAVPTDSAITGVAAMQLRPDQLTARCHACQSGVLRRRNREAKRATSDQLALLDITTDSNS